MNGITELGFQSRVNPWLLDCFGAEIAGDKVERNHRFLEEALELAQACGCTASEAYQLVSYTFSRPVGEKAQEAGGVMVTLAALCLAQGLDMAEAGETELRRIWGKVETIRAKQAAKPKHSPLPEVPPSAKPGEYQVGGPTAVFADASDAAAYIALRNHAEKLLAVCEAAEAVDPHAWTCLSGDPNEWEALDKLRAALRDLEGA